MIRSTLLCILISLAAAAHVAAQSIYTEFGKNRVQYHDDFSDWWMYETENFVTYWYGKGRNIAQLVIQIAEHDNDEIQSILEHRFSDKIEIIVYVDLTDLRQSNLGSEEVFASATGRTKILGNKMFVYFNGDHQDLRRQIRRGIAAVYLESMLYGTNLQEVVQNAVLLGLPDWYRDGLVSYIAEEWAPELDDRLVDIFSQRRGRYRDFHRLVRDHPEIAGHSLWYYIGRTYGKSTIANILYLTRIHRNLDNAVLYVLGLKFDQLLEGWTAYMSQRYPQTAAWSGQDLLRLPRRNTSRITVLSLSPDGRMLAYALNDAGRSRLYLMDVASEGRKRIHSSGKKDIIQEPDYQYPVLAWRDDGAVLSMIHERRDVIYLSHFDLATDTWYTDLLSPEYQRVYSMDYWHPDTLILSASTDGLSNLYKYSIRTRQTFAITNDYFDDLDITTGTLFGRQGLLFRSNRNVPEFRPLRLDTILPVENSDVWFAWPEGRGWGVKNLTNAPQYNARSPLIAGPQTIAFLTNESGQWNRKTLTITDEDVHDGDILRDTRKVTHHTVDAAGQTGFVAFVADGRQRILQTGVTPYDADAGKRFVPRDPDADPDDDRGAKGALDAVDPRYLFQSQFTRPEGIVLTPAPATEMPAPTVRIPTRDTLREWSPRLYNPQRVVVYRPARAIAHRLRFKIDYINTTMDNSLLFSSLDSYAGVRQEYQSPPFGILLKGNIKDLFEDYIIEGGARFPTAFNGSEYFLYFDDLKRRIDKRYAVYRRSSITTTTPGFVGIERHKDVTVIAQYRLSYPFDTYTSIRTTATMRNDRQIQLATDRSNLEIPIADDQRIGLNLEYVYDNTIEWDVNTRHGTRYKVWAEVVKKFDLNLFERGEKLTFNRGFMTVLGIDARHYEPLDRHSVFAARFYASTSFGSERNLYYLGGMENWLFSSFDNTIPVPQDKNFAYQTIAANMRGFNYNARNGASVALINSELRVPFLRYLSRRKLRSSFLRNLQATAFFDIGTAWHGPDPFSDENPLNTLRLENPPTVVVDVQYFRNPIIYSYGVGVRTMLFGYFIKADYAWGWETKRQLDPKLHISLGFDF